MSVKGVFPVWDSLQHGDSVDVVIQIIVDGGNHWIATTMDRPNRKLTVTGDLPKESHAAWVVLQAKVKQVSPPVLEIGEVGAMFPIKPCTCPKLEQVVELCCGIGAFSSVAAANGLRTVAGVDVNSKWEPLFRACHGASCEFLCGECGAIEIIHKLLNLGAMHSLVLSGINCQPFSTGGDRRGLSDPRSSSLFQSLKTAWLLQAPLLVLECTPEIRHDTQVQAVLSAYCSAAGCYMTQTVLSLHEVWCTRRDRWYAVISAAPFGPVVIPPPPVVRDFSMVGLVMPYLLDWSAEDREQLDLSLYELSRFHSYAAGGFQKALLDLKSCLPTLLHSCGNQLYDCRCGCRKALSQERLASRGLFGTLIAVKGTVWHENQHMQQCRYFHPREMFLMQGGSPKIDFGSDHRLSMAGIGQCVSPIQATWILAHLRRATLLLCGLPLNDPVETLSAHIDSLLDDRDALWPTPLNRADFMPTDHPIRIWDHDTSSMIEFRCKSVASVGQFLRAESALGSFPQLADGSPVQPPIWTGDSAVEDVSLNMHWLSDLSLGTFPSAPATAKVVPCPCLEPDEAMGPDVSPVVVSPTLSFEVCVEHTAVSPPVRGDVLELLDRQKPSLLSVCCPRLTSLAGASSLLCRVLSADARRQILSNQVEAWADDELRFYCQQIVNAALAEQCLMTWDPLALSSVVHFCNMTLLHELISCVPQTATVVSACMIDGHWYGVCWRCTADGVLAYTCGHPCNVSLALQRVHQEFCKHRGCQVVPIHFRSMPFVVDSCCGALAVAFLRHLVFGLALLDTRDQLRAFHDSLRTEFSQSLPESVPRPWVWGLGESKWKVKLGLLLQEHGVEATESTARAGIVIQKLGEDGVEKAIQSKTPWRDLKWLANQCTPPYQLIRPTELQEAINRRTKEDKPIGNRSQKTKSRGKQSLSPKAIDPSGLRIEAGIFECGNGISLQQIDLAHIGPQVSGVVLTSLASALPYLKSGRQVSAGGLGFLIVDCAISQVPTSLISEPLRIPAICVANSEPVLIDAILFQLGAIPVSKRIHQDACSIVTLSSCVVKIFAFKDQLDLNWEAFVRHPVKHIFSKIPPLQPCDDEECSGDCEAWHPTDAVNIPNPVMELWGKQWMMLNFQQVSALQSEVFSVHMRVPSCLAVQLQTYSGPGGLFLEPKHVDGRQASDVFQVFWLPKMSYQEVLHVKQTTPHVLGIARLGTKLGVRCKATCAEQVHGHLRPGGSFLPPGKKMLFLLGPLPFGTIRDSLVELLSSIAWVARPLQPVAAAAHIAGVMWKIQSTTLPPVSVVSTDKGDVVITKLDEPRPEQTALPAVVAASRTLDLCTAPPGLDPLQINDPWAAAHKVAVPPPVTGGQDPLVEFERKLVDAVLARIPKDAMDVDSVPVDCATTDRVNELERKVQELREGQHGLHSMIIDQGRAQGTQISSVQQQVQQIDSKLGEHNATLSTFQQQFTCQLAQQESRLDSLFRQQMDRLEDLFTKKPRHE